MHRSFHSIFPLALTLAAALPPQVGRAEEPATGCAAFTWDVARELALMEHEAASIQAGTSPQAAAKIEPGRHYAVRLSQQSDVRFAAQPGKPASGNDTSAGLLALRVPHDGRYRIAIGSSHWIDVIDAGAVLPSRDFQGRRGCEAIHKIVEFELPAGRELLLQFSAGTQAQIDLAIVAGPAPGT